MKLLILNTAILAAGDLTETADSIQSPDAIYPKHVINGWQIVEVEVPDGFAPAGYLWDGITVGIKPISPEEQAAAVERIIADITAAAQRKLDTFAQTRNYDGILSAATYATSTNQTFASEGQYAVTARDNTWATLYTVMAEVQAGTRPMPTGFADVESALPVLAWPA